MKRIYEKMDILDLEDMIIEATEGKKFTTCKAMANELNKINGMTVSEIVSGEYLVIEFEGSSYLVFVTEKAPYQVISVENDVDFEK